MSTVRRFVTACSILADKRYSAYTSGQYGRDACDLHV
jgi:hypothetical protein